MPRKFSLHIHFDTQLSFLSLAGFWTNGSLICQISPDSDISDECVVSFPPRTVQSSLTAFRSSGNSSLCQPNICNQHLISLTCLHRAPKDILSYKANTTPFQQYIFFSSSSGTSKLSFLQVHLLPGNQRRGLDVQWCKQPLTEPALWYLNLVFGCANI